MKKKYRQATNLIRSGLNRSNFNETSEGLFLTSGFVYGSAEEAEACFNETKTKYMYSRFSNPTIEAFEKKLAIIEGAEACWATASGMSAVFTIFMSQLSSGDRIVSSRALFGSCNHVLTKILPKFGIDVVLIDGTDLNKWEKELKKKTNLVFFETPSNPCLEIVDIAEVSKLAHACGALVVVDNVFATPILQKPLEHGADIVMYSATKHIDGQGRVLGGAILGSQKFCDEKIKPFIRNTGPSLSPFNAWVLLKSLETLELRVTQQVKNTKKIVDYLENSTKIQDVIYPWSENFKQTKLAKKQMSSGGNIISFRVKCRSNETEKIDTFKLVNKLKLIDIANNLGDSKTLITHPYSTTHNKLNEKEKKSLRITENLLRLSVGLEDAEDLIEDLENSIS